MTDYRCTECGLRHEGDCDQKDKTAWALDCAMDRMDEVLGLPPEPGSRRWLIERGELPPLDTSGG